MATDNQDRVKTLHEAQIYQALGAFLLFFALIVLLSILFTGTGIGQLTNLAAGVVLGGIGGAMFLQGRRAGRKHPADP
jgi:uncharacterized protein YybS (DUF2232 family)